MRKKLEKDQEVMKARNADKVKALINEEFGNGIMSAIDFSMHLEREPHPKGDRVRLTMSGKYLPYANW